MSEIERMLKRAETERKKQYTVATEPRQVKPTMIGIHVPLVPPEYQVQPEPDIPSQMVGITAPLPTEPEPSKPPVPIFAPKPFKPDEPVPGSVAEAISSVPTDLYPAPPIPETKFPYTYGTGTTEQLLGQTGEYVPPKRDVGFYAPDVVSKRRESMELQKGYFIGRDDEGRPIYKTVSPAKYYHGYVPGYHDLTTAKTYDEFLKKLKENYLVASESIDVSKKAQTYIPEIQDFIRQLESAPSGSTVTYTEVLPSGEEVLHENVPVKEALPYFRGHLKSLEETADKLSEYESIQSRLVEQEKTIRGYRDLGYSLRITDKGEYVIEEPKSYDVMKWKHKGKTDVLLVSASFLASPLAVQTWGSGLGMLVTGDEKIREAELERLSEYALGLDVAIKKGEYVGRVLISPAMAEGVYLPLATFGIAKGISLGVTGMSPYVISGAERVTTTFTKVVGHLPSKLQTVITVAKQPVIFAGKGGLRIMGTAPARVGFKYGVFLGLSGQQLLTVPKERFAGEFARALFRYELQWGAMKLGFKGTKVDAKKWVEKDILETKGIPPSVKQQEVVGRLYVGHRPLSDTRGKFGVIGKALVKQEGQKPVEVYLTVKGWTKTHPQIQLAESIGAGKFSFYDVSGVEKISFRPIYTSSTEFAKAGKTKLLYSTETVMGKVEPYTGESITKLLKLSETEKLSFDYFTAKGEYSNIIEDVIGKHKFIGLSFGVKTGGKLLEFGDLGTKIASELAHVTKTLPSVVGMKLIVAEPLKVFGTGIGAGVTTKVTEKVSEQLVSDKKMVLTKTEPIQIQKLDVDTKPVSLIGVKTDKLLEEKKEQITKTISVTKPALETIDKEILVTKPIVDVITEEQEKYEPVLITGIMPTQIQQQRQLQKLGLQQEQMLETEQITITDILPISPIEPIIPVPIIPIILTDEKDKPRHLISKPSKERGYDVFVKERSMFHGEIIRPTKFKKENINVLTKRDALGLGATIADETPAVSFKIKPTEGSPKSSLRTHKPIEKLIHKFRKKGDVYIEKNPYRLDSPGEQKGISELGRLSRKRNLLGKEKKKKKKDKNITKRRKNVRYI